MAFDPTKPANNSPISSAELRSQLTSLKALIDAGPTTASMQSYVLANTAGPIGVVDELGFTVSDPPTQSEMQEVVNKIDQLIAVLKRF